MIEEGNIIAKVKLPFDLPPAKRRIQRPEGYRERYNNTDLQTGALVSLRFLDLFGSAETGAILLANLLGGLRATALQKQEKQYFSNNKTTSYSYALPSFKLYGVVLLALPFLSLSLL